MLVPCYQNALNIFFTVLFLALYTVVVNTRNPNGAIQTVEVFLFAMVFGFFLGEIALMFPHRKLNTADNSRKFGLRKMGLTNVYDVFP